MQLPRRRSHHSVIGIGRPGLQDSRAPPRASAPSVCAPVRSAHLSSFPQSSTVYRLPVFVLTSPRASSHRRRRIKLPFAPPLLSGQVHHHRHSSSHANPDIFDFANHLTYSHPGQRPPAFLGLPIASYPPPSPLPPATRAPSTWRQHLTSPASDSPPRKSAIPTPMTKPSR